MQTPKSVTTTRHFRGMANLYLLKEPWSVFCERVLDNVVNSALGTARHNTLSERQVNELSIRSIYHKNLISPDRCAQK